MGVSKLSGLFNSIVTHIVAGTGYKSSNVQRPSNVEQEDTFVGKSRGYFSGKALASATDESKSVKESGSRLSRLLQDAADYYSAA